MKRLLKITNILLSEKNTFVGNGEMFPQYNI